MAKHQLARVLGATLPPAAVRVLAVAGIATLAFEVGLIVKACGIVRSLAIAEDDGARLEMGAKAFLSSVRGLAIATGPNASLVNFESPHDRLAYREFLASTSELAIAFPGQSASREELRAWVEEMLDRLRHSAIWLSDQNDPWKTQVRLVPFSKAASVRDDRGDVLVIVSRRVSSVYLDGTPAKIAFNEASFGTMVAAEDLQPGLHELLVQTLEGDFRSMKFPILERTMTTVDLTPPH